MKQMKMMKNAMSLFLIMVMFSKNGDIWIYTGVTSVNGDRSNIGFLLANERTGEAHYYSIAGADEKSAMAAAEGEVQEKGYQASFPSLINVEGHPTYIMVLKDASGLVKLYAAVNVEQYNIVTTASSQTECLNRYKQLLGIESGSADNNNNQPDNSTSTDNDASNSVTGSSDISEPTVADAETNLTITDIKYIDINGNTYISLNSIRFMAQVSKFDGIRKMAEALIKILSCSFRGSISFYTVREELDVLDSYLYLMKIRYSDGFEVVYDIDETCLDCKVPRLILQPIVENSIVHGLAEKEDDIGHLTVRLKASGDSLIFTVEDDGRGMTEEEIRQLLTHRERAEGDNTSIGVENVLSRLKLNFGSRYGIRMESQPGQYTKTILTIPLMNERDG